MADGAITGIGAQVEFDAAVVADLRGAHGRGAAGLDAAARRGFLDGVGRQSQLAGVEQCPELRQLRPGRGQGGVAAEGARGAFGIGFLQPGVAGLLFVAAEFGEIGGTCGDEFVRTKQAMILQEIMTMHGFVKK